jgi:DNA ligase (NAD+)
VSGVFLGITREEIENIIVRLGGRNTGSISGKTDYLIAGHKLEDGRQTN